MNNENCKKLSVSVIIPNYNSENYLYECLDSIILENEYLPQEIIIVDDASTDGSFEIARKYQQKYPETVKVRKLEKNCGAALARLEGVKISACDLILFIDADDKISDNAIYLACQKIDKEDIVLFDMYKLNNGDTYKAVNIDNILFPIRGTEACKLTFGGWKIHSTGLIKKDIILKAYHKVNNFSFYNVDEVVTRYVIYEAKQITFCKQSKYFYRTNLNSSGHKNINNIVPELEISIKLDDLIDEFGYIDTEKGIKKWVQASVIGKYFYSLKIGQKLNDSLQKKVIDKIRTYKIIFFIRNLSRGNFKNDFLTIVKLFLLRRKV